MPKPGWWSRATKGGKAGRARGVAHGYRSGLEERNGKHLEALGVPVRFEERRIKYLVPAQTRTYTPDFELPNGIIVETKGIFDATDRAKHLFIKLQYPELDIRFVFSRGAQKIAPGAKTTLAEWADKHGYKWAERLIPKEWLDEPGPGAVAVDRLLSQAPKDL